MDRYLVISADGHAGLPAADYREYVLPQYRDAFDAALPIQIAMTETMAKQFLVSDINKEWRKGNESGITGAWDHTARNKVVDDDGVTAEVLFPDGVTEMNSPPFQHKEQIRTRREKREGRFITSTEAEKPTYHSACPKSSPLPAPWLFSRPSAASPSKCRTT